MSCTLLKSENWKCVVDFFRTHLWCTIILSLSREETESLCAFAVWLTDFKFHTHITVRLLGANLCSCACFCCVCLTLSPHCKGERVGPQIPLKEVNRKFLFVTDDTSFYGHARGKGREKEECIPVYELVNRKIKAFLPEPSPFSPQSYSRERVWAGNNWIMHLTKMHKKFKFNVARVFFVVVFHNQSVSVTAVHK